MKKSSNEAVSSWCRHGKEERERSGDVQINSVFRYMKAETSGKQKLGDRERKLRVKEIQRSCWSGERREQSKLRERLCDPGRDMEKKPVAPRVALTLTCPLCQVLAQFVLILKTPS